MAHDPDSLAVVGERDALARILPLLPTGDGVLLGPGDDCAVIAAPDARVCITTDTMVEGPDFRLDWSTWDDLGRKAAATNLSDIASMGARATGLVVALAVPPTTLVSSLEEFARGMADAVRTLAPGCGVVGGDLGTASEAVIAITAFGDLEGRAPVTRGGARPGDLVAVAGGLGLAGIGLRMLMDAAGERAEAGSASAREVTAAVRAAHPLEVDAQLRPAPPLHLGRELAIAGATAMLDISDSLALDAARLAIASGVRVALDSSAFRGGEAAVDRDAALYGGEDHALLATVPAGVSLPEGVHVIGVVEAGDGVMCDGVVVEPRGWDPYRR